MDAASLFRWHKVGDNGGWLTPFSQLFKNLIVDLQVLRVNSAAGQPSPFICHQVIKTATNSQFTSATGSVRRLNPASKWPTFSFDRNAHPLQWPPENISPIEVQLTVELGEVKSGLSTAFDPRAPFVRQFQGGSRQMSNNLVVEGRLTGLLPLALAHKNEPA